MGSGIRVCIGRARDEKGGDEYGIGGSDGLNSGGGRGCGCCDEGQGDDKGEREGKDLAHV